MMLTLFVCFLLLRIVHIRLVPFDEEEKEKDVWFLDHEYLENMYTMFRKVNGNEQ
jgi:hypothetical protein